MAEMLAENHREAGSHMRPFGFGVVFWGAEFRGYFLDFCLPSLLAPGNIPAIENKAESCFLICAPAEDWQAMQAHRTFRLLADHIRPVHLDFTTPGPAYDKMRVMSFGHKLVAEWMHRERVWGVFVYPDTVFADGVVAEAQRLGRLGKKCVLAHCPRFANEGFLDELRARGEVEPGKPLCLSGRELIRLAMPHLHSEMIRYDWDSRYFYAESPPLIFWRLPRGGMLFHTTAWALMLVDYSHIDRHDTWALDNWTIDGDYIQRNFPDPRDVHAVTGDDEMTLISFTPEANFTYLPLQLPPDQSLGRKIYWLNRYVHRNVIDPLKLELFKRPLMISGGPVGLLTHLQKLRARVVVALMLAPPWVVWPFRFRAELPDRIAHWRYRAGEARRYLGRTVDAVVPPARRAAVHRRLIGLMAAPRRLRARAARLREFLSARAPYLRRTLLSGNPRRMRVLLRKVARRLGVQHRPARRRLPHAPGAAPLVFYFTAIFWGGQYRQYFLDLLVASLLAPGNIPSLRNREDSRFVICTTATDWAAVQEAPAFQELARFIQPIWIEIPYPEPGANKMLSMSKGHMLVSELAYAARALGVFVTPDLVLSDGSVRRLQELAEQKIAVVLCAALRFTYEGCIPELRRRGFLAPGMPLTISGRQLMEIACANLHSETLRFDIAARDFAEWPSAVLWRVSPVDVLVHSFSWAPLLVDYAQLGGHSTTTFDNWTLDGDYIYANFGDDTRRVHVVTDSDEIALVSFTQEAEHTFLPLQPRSLFDFPVIGYLVKLLFTRRFYHSAQIDPLKRRIFTKPVRWRGGADATASLRWLVPLLRARLFVLCARSTGWFARRFDQLADRLWTRHIAKYYYATDLFEETINDLMANESAGARRLLPRLFARLCGRGSRTDENSRRMRLHGRVPPRAENYTFLNQYGPGSHLVLRISPPISAGRWYWEIHSPNIGAAGPGVGVTGSFGVITGRHSIAREIGDSGEGWGWRGDGMKTGPSGAVPYGAAADRADEVIMVALDMDAGELWFGRNGIWFEGGNPAEGINPAFAGLSGLVYPAISSLHGGGGSAVLMSRVEPQSWKYPPPQGFEALTRWTPRAISVTGGEVEALIGRGVIDAAPGVR
jgi:hypothetical protein